MSNKIFKEMLKPQANMNRNGFDNSYLHNFTAKIGELLPVMCLETVPNSHYEISVSDLMRTVPMNNPAFIRASQHFEFYFVPYKQLWRRWDDFYTSRSVPVSANDSFAIPSCTPNSSMLAILKAFVDARTNQVGYRNQGDLSEYIGLGCTKVANLLGYAGLEACGITPDDDGSILADLDIARTLGNLKPNLFRAAAYQKICFDYYRQPFYDLPELWTAKTFNFDDVLESNNNAVVDDIYTDENNTIKTHRLARLFQLHYRQWKKDIYTGVLPSTQFGAVAVVSTGGSGSEIQQAVELAVSGSTSSRSISSAGPALNRSMRLNASSSQFEDFSGDIESYNGLLSNQDGQYYHGVYLGNDVNLENEPDILVEGTIPQLSVSGTSSGNITIPSTGTGSFDILSLVRSLAIQKWRETTLRSGFRNTSQYEGHFGVKPIFTEKDRCVFIDSISSPLQVNTVTNMTAPQSEGDAALGDLGANGTSVIGPDKTIKFDAKDFGVIMCIYSVLPEATYNDFGLDMMNQKVLRDDFFTPEFENIGMQPITNLSRTLTAQANTLGYVPRYSEYKCGYDRQTAEFSDMLADETGGYTGLFGEWSPSRKVDGDVEIDDFYVNPMYYRNIFVSLPWLPYVPGTEQETETTADDRGAYIGSSRTDTFIHQCYFDIKSVQPMSVLGLPSY